MYDVLGMRVIVDAAPGATPTLPELEAACHHVERLVTALWEPLPGRRKDYISRPKANGYQSLHVAVRAPGSSRAVEEPSAVEVQIRSTAMHTAAEHGASAHFAYKGGLDRAQTARLQDWTLQLMQACCHSHASDCACLCTLPVCGQAFLNERTCVCRRSAGRLAHRFKSARHL